MNISYNWLKKYIALDLEPEAVSKILTSIGLEVGGVEEVETIKVLGSLVGFYIDGDAGETHALKMEYRPNTFFIGLTVSSISAAFLILLIALEKTMKKVPFLRAVVSIPDQPALPEATEEINPNENTPSNDESAT